MNTEGFFRALGTHLRDQFLGGRFGQQKKVVQTNWGGDHKLGKWLNDWYCWWKKSCTSWNGKYPNIYMVLYIPGGAYCWNTSLWFQICFFFTPIWGRFPISLIFLRWVETTNQNKLKKKLVNWSTCEQWSLWFSDVSCGLFYACCKVWKPSSILGPWGYTDETSCEEICGFSKWWGVLETG